MKIIKSFFRRLKSNNDRPLKTATDDKTTTVVFGKQEWMTKNLNLINYRNGELLNKAETKEEWDKYGKEGIGCYCYYDNNSSFGNLYGVLYNWFAVNDPRGLAPQGWHIPSDKEWDDLINYLGGYKNAPYILFDSNNKSGNNSFNAKFGGKRDNKLGFIGMKNSESWWTSTQENENQAYCRCGNNIVFKEIHRYSEFKISGYSVRCIKDEKNKTNISSFALKLTCPHCSQIHRSNSWPVNGDRTSFYFQKEEGRYNLPVICPHCKRGWYVVWDEEPGTIMKLDL